MKKGFLLTVIVFIYAISSALCYGEYDAAAPLMVRRVEFSNDKPKGYGKFQLRDGGIFKRAEDIFIYIEVSNCMSERDTRYYHTKLTMDVDIYYEDGLKIYSAEDTNFSDVQFNTKRDEGYIWTKIETSCLKEGGYKVEMTVRDENSDKKAFALTTFRIL